MSSQIEIFLEKPSTVVIGMGKVSVIVDGRHELLLSLGESKRVKVSAGKHIIQTTLNGLIQRRSNKLEVFVEEESTSYVVGKYSQTWGNIELHSSTHVDKPDKQRLEANEKLETSNSTFAAH